MLAGSALLGCSEATDAPPGWAPWAAENAVGAPCQEGEVRPCSVTLEQENGRLTCYHGTQICTSGKLANCDNGEIVQQVDPTFEDHEAFFRRRGLSLSSPTVCDDNACDPTCMMFVEDPDDIGLGGAGPTPTDLPEWEGCTHGLCQEGAGLESDCSTCTTSVCAVDPTCCDESDPNGWDADCTGLVPPVCDGSAPELGLCDFVAFSELSLSFGPGSTTDGGPLGSGSTLALEGVTTGSSLSSGGTVLLDGGDYSGFVYATGAIDSINGAMTASSKLHSGVTVSAPALPTRTLSCSAPSGVVHTIGAATLTANPGAADTYQVNNAASVLVLSGPGNYGSVQASAAGKIVFVAGGTYRFDSLSSSGAAPTLLVPPGESVIIETCSNLSFPSGANVLEFSRSTNSCATAPAWSSAPWWYGSGVAVLRGGRHYVSKSGHDPIPANEPGVGASWASVWNDNGVCSLYTYTATATEPESHMVHWYTGSSGTVSVGPGLLAHGTLVAPLGTVTLTAGDHHGLVYARQVAAMVGASLSGADLTGSACVTALGVAAASTECPISTAPPLLNEPCVTGLDCQVNHRCTEPETGATCGHSKCAPGAALDPACDECVERICDVDDTCCTDSWTDECVQKVATVCDAVCDDYACLHGPCDVGVALEPTCDPCIATVCAQSGFETCCTDGWTFACALEFREVCGAPPTVTEPVAGGSLCDYSAFGRYEMQTQGATMSGGWVGSPASASQNIANSLVNGHATSSGSLNAFGSIVTGNLLSGSGSLAAGTVLGMILTGTPPTPVLPDKSLTGCSSYPDPRSGTLPPGTYGDVTVASGSDLILSEGTYQFNSLTVGAGGEIALPSDGGIVEINACNNIDLGVGAFMSGLTQATAMNVSVYTEGYFAARGDNDLFGLIVSEGTVPYYSGPCFAGDPCDLSLLQAASIYIGQNSTVYGIVAGERRVDIRGGTLVDATGLEDMCELLWDPGTTVTWPACPATVTPELPAEGGACEANATGYEDLTCVGFDLALGVPCDESVPVCNHGTEDFDDVVEIGFWDISEAQLSTPTPPAPTGTCSAAVMIPAGECTVVDCPTLPPTPQTLMVNPSGTAAECDGRLLDNWSLFDGRTCGSVETETIKHVYEATCPPDSYPSWGLLTWSSETPSGSTITFSATTAPTSAELATAPPPTLLGVAQEGPPDTQDCRRSGPFPSCPVDITGVLALEGYMDPFLELTIELSGATSPTLEDWKLTYSCVIDQ